MIIRPSLAVLAVAAIALTACSQQTAPAVPSAADAPQKAAPEKRKNVEKDKKEVMPAAALVRVELAKKGKGKNKQGGIGVGGGMVGGDGGGQDAGTPTRGTGGGGTGQQGNTGSCSFDPTWSAHSCFVPPNDSYCGGCAAGKFCVSLGLYKGQEKTARAYECMSECKWKHFCSWAGSFGQYRPLPKP